MVCRVPSDKTELDSNTAASSGRGKDLEAMAATRRRWEPWTRATGAKLLLGGRRVHELVGTNAEDMHGTFGSNRNGYRGSKAVTAIDRGLLWRGPLFFPSAAVAVTAPEASVSSVVSRSTIVYQKEPSPRPASSAGSNGSLPRTDKPYPCRKGSLPSLEGFALRAVLPRHSKTPNVNVGTSCKRDRHDTGSVSVASATADILGRASSFRLARVISPATLARACHLLADATAAPALELYVYDADRFPGSAAFLDAWAADGRGMLLVATASKTPAKADVGTAGTAGTVVDGSVGRREEEGLAMACFPRRSRLSGEDSGGYEASAAAGGTAGFRGEDEAVGGREAKTSERTVWSVTLFRRPSEFSEEAVSALVGESSGSGGGDHSERDELYDADFGCSDSRSSSPSVTDAATSCPPSLSHLAELGSDNNKTTRRFRERGRVADTSSTATKNRTNNPGAVTEALASLPVFSADTLHSEACRLLSAVRSPGLSEQESPANDVRGNRRSTPRRRASAAAKRPKHEAPELESAQSGTTAERGTGAQSKRHKRGSGEKLDVRMKGTGAAKLNPAAAARESAIKVEAALNDAMDSWAAGLPANCRPSQDSHRDEADGGKVAKRRNTRSQADVSSGDVGDTTGSPTAAERSSYALYGSFGSWADRGRPFWAEEALLPGPPPDRSRPFSGRPTQNGRIVAGSWAARNAGGDIDARVALGAAVSSSGREGIAVPRSGIAVNVESNSNSVASIGDGRHPAAPLRRTLSIAEEALEKAGQQQRARVKERRIVARKQRARMDCPRPRPRSRSSSGGGSSALLRTGSGTLPPTLGAVGRSLSGSKLSRGSRILGQSVGATATATAAAGVAVIGDGASGTDRLVDGVKVSVRSSSSSASSASLPASTTISRSLARSRSESNLGGEKKSSLAPPLTHDASDLGRKFEGNGRRRSRSPSPPATSQLSAITFPGILAAAAAPATAGSSVDSATSGGRVRRAIFQDACPPQRPILAAASTTSEFTTMPSAASAIATVDSLESRNASSSTPENESGKIVHAAEERNMQVEGGVGERQWGTSGRDIVGERVGARVSAEAIAIGASGDSSGEAALHASAWYLR